MIEVSTRGRYALRAMIDVALYDGRGPVLRHDLAERQGISADYAAQLFQQLRAAGLVDSVKGPGGGYRLARDASSITAAEVIQAVEGPLAIVHCARPGHDGEDACSREAECAAHLLWLRLSATIAELLGSVTLQDLCDQAARLVEQDRDRQVEPAG